MVKRSGSRGNHGSKNTTDPMYRDGPEEHQGLSAVNSPPRKLFLLTRLFLLCLLTESAPACSSAVTTATCCKARKVSPVSESRTRWLPGVTTDPSAEVSPPVISSNHSVRSAAQRDESATVGCISLKGYIYRASMLRLIHRNVFN